MFRIGLVRQALGVVACVASAAPAGLPAAAAANVATPPPAHAGVSYQIGGAFPAAPGVDVVDRDRRAPAPLGRYGICYVNAFQAQPGQVAW